MMQTMRVIEGEIMVTDRLPVLFRQLSPGIRTHCAHTSVYARVISEQIPSLDDYFSGEDKESILTAIMEGGLYHDIGKLAISTYILNKKSGLSDVEWQIVRNHPFYAEELLENSLSDDVSGTCHAIILDMARYHHERIDGTGYPYGLSGDNIPIAAQICAVADTFDAMTSYRRYRRAKSVSAAYKIICENAGTQFGTNVVEWFKLAYPEMCSLYKSGKR